MEWREIEIFLTLADELHFGRTAERLRLSQARVSQTLRVLERRVGGRLVERTSRQVRLSPLGERFREELRPGYDQILRAFQSARGTAQGIAGELRISVTSILVGGPLFDQFIREFEIAHPLCRVRVSDTDTVTGLHQARDGRVDIVAAYLPLDQSDLTIGPIVSSRARALAVATNHPLAARGYATVDDLADFPIMKVAGVPEETLDGWVPPRTPSGRPTKRVPVTATLNGGVAIGAIIAGGQLGHLTVAGLLENLSYYTGLAEIPMRGLPPLESALVWVTNRESAAIRAFAKVAEEVMTSAAVPDQLPEP